MTDPTDKTPTSPRPQITELDIFRALNRVTTKLDERLTEKGRGAFLSRHEIYGIIAEERHEFIEAVQQGELRHVEAELVDIAVAAIFGIACINSGKVEW